MGQLRNICIIAHVDHGKTTLVDHLLSQAGTHDERAQVAERVMDSDDQERERGITISAKNASFRLGDLKVNIIDTPGHADFGGEVERIMGMVDGAILLVDAAEGPLPQTRFVLEKAIQRNLKVILCVNKVDRPQVQDTDLIERCVDKTFDLFVDLGASDDQCDFPIVFASAKFGWCTQDRNAVDGLVRGDAKGDLKPLYELIRSLPSPLTDDRDGDSSAGFCMQVANIGYDDYLGTLAIGRVRSGLLKPQEYVLCHGVDGDGNPSRKRFQVPKILTFEGLQQRPTEQLGSGDIGLIAGHAFDIGDTICSEGVEPLPRITVEEPTMRMIFSINTSPNSGREGTAVQSRELQERLLRETRHNVALRLQETESADRYYLLGRGELQFAIIIEAMRREGFEFMVGRPTVLYEQASDGGRLEPFEKLTINLPESSASDVTSLYQQRKGVLCSYEQVGGSQEETRVQLEMEIPTRGLLGTLSQFRTITRGSGLMASEGVGYRPHVGEILHRQCGSIVADRNGKTTAYALASIQQRGVLFVGEGVEVYEGMIIGEGNHENDLNVNAVKPKKLTNVRSVNSDGLTVLQGLRKMSLEACIEWIDEDEWIEVTPESVRLRKKILASNQRSVRRADRID